MTIIELQDALGLDPVPLANATRFGQYVRTPGGGMGWYVGTTRAGIEVVAYDSYAQALELREANPDKF